MDGVDSGSGVPSWAKEFSVRLKSLFVRTLQSEPTVSLMLTGGRAALVLYRVLGEIVEDCIWERIEIFFGDERCVDESSPYSNAYSSLVALFPNGIPFPSRVNRMWTDSYDPISACDRYHRLLPDSIDILLLSMGDDGHIASLFPGSPVISKRSRKVVPVRSPIVPHSRISITPAVIESAKHVFVLAIGESKQSTLKMLFNDPNNIEQFPARLALHGTWIVETSGEF